MKDLFIEFAKENGRELKLEIEPSLFARSCLQPVTRIQDITSTGKDGYRFLKLDYGMTEILRPSLYGAQHPIHLVCEPGQQKFRESMEQVVVGHCCESGDLLTAGDPEALFPGTPKGEIGDFFVIEGAELCSSMSAKNYNSFTEAAEVLRREDGKHPDPQTADF